MDRRLFLAASMATGVAAMSAPKPKVTTSPPPETPHCLFISAHPDDETLMSGVTMAEHFAAGLDVHVLWLTDGEASGVLGELNGKVTSAWWGDAHNPADEGYPILTAADMAAARVREAANAVNALRTGEPGTLTVHYAHLPDGGVTQAAAQAAILAVCNEFDATTAWRLKGHTDVVDTHPDHLAAGKAVRALQKSTPARFADCRYYINPAHWADANLSRVTHSWDLPTDGTIRSRAVNAYRSYGAWSPPNTYAIGMHSVASMFTPLLATPKCLYHT